MMPHPVKNWEVQTVGQKNNRLWEGKGRQSSPDHLLMSSSSSERTEEGKAANHHGSCSAAEMCQQSSVRGARSTVCPPSPEDDGIGGRKKRIQSVEGVDWQKARSNRPPSPSHHSSSSPLQNKIQCHKMWARANSSSPACRGVCFKVEMRLMAHLAISPAANIKGEEKTAANFLLWPLAPAGISYKRWFMEEPNSSLLLD